MSQSVKTAVLAPIKQWLCGLFLHKWTSAAEEGIKPTEAQLNGGIEGFYDYATMYCRICKYESRLNKKHRIQATKQHP